MLPPATPGRRDEGDWQRKDASRLGRHVRHRSLEAVGEWRGGFFPLQRSPGLALLS